MIKSKEQIPTPWKQIPNPGERIAQFNFTIYFWPYSDNPDVPSGLWYIGNWRFPNPEYSHIKTPFSYSMSWIYLFFFWGVCVPRLKNILSNDCISIFLTTLWTDQCTLPKLPFPKTVKKLKSVARTVSCLLPVPRDTSTCWGGGF